MHARQTAAERGAQPGFGRDDQERTEHRPGDGADTADQGQQGELEADVGQREQAGRVDGAHVHREQCAASGRQRRADGGATQLHRGDVDAAGTGGVLVFSHCKQVVTQATAPDQRRDSHADRHEREHQQRVVNRVGKDHVRQRRLERNLQTARPARQRFEVIGADHADLIERQRRDGEERAFQSKGRPEDHRADDGAHQHCRQYAEPRRDFPQQIQPGRHVGADREEHTVPQRELAPEARHDVPGHRQSGEQVGVDEDVDPERLARQQNQRCDGCQQAREAQDQRAAPRSKAAFGQCLRLCLCLWMRGDSVVCAIHDCSRKPISSAPTWPNNPLGLKTSTPRKMRNQMACLSSGSM